jgi:hypothetical protein
MSTNKKIRMACGMVIVALAVSQGFAATLHVDPNDPTAFQSIQRAIDAAKTFDTVVVHPGVYRGGIDFKAKAITVKSVDPNDPSSVATTVIDGSGGVAAVTFQTGETEYSVLLGLTIRNGFTGVECKDMNTRPQIRECMIRSNKSDGIKGGRPSIVGCEIAENGASGVADCYGPIRDCNILANAGSGVHFPTPWGGQGTNTTIINCMIVGNANGVVSRNPYYRFDVVNCVISGNGGDGIHTDYGMLDVVNCTVVGNKGYGVFHWFPATTSEPTSISNSIIAYNWVLGLNGARSEYNNVYGNRGGTYTSASASKHDICETPWFTDNGYWDTDGVWHQGDYHLMSTVGRWDPAAKAWVKDPIDSPCIDKGDPNTPVGDEPYPNGGRINLGAYGGTAEASKSLGGLKCVEYPAMDFNHDCQVDQADLDIFMQHWLDCGLDDPNACWPQGPPASPNVQP